MKSSSHNTANGSYARRSIFTTRVMVTVSLLSALSYVLMLLESPPFIGFLRLEFSDVPAIIGAFWFGPAAGIVIEFIKNVIKAITASKTLGIGELANLIVSIAYVVPASLLFRKLKGRYKSVLAFGAATLSMTVAGFLMNYFVTIPMYAKMYGGIENIVAAASMIPGINDMFTLILIGITPFNIIKGIFLGVVGHISYEMLKKTIHFE
ncbi:Riboflavin transporter FmnP [Anaerocolumna jejuensis DSM 15929]|jgi:riboflavin transporter FmnP|uniref:Riboflavin transporter n=1 Tax=Anaerocolumna jejuensis DSM 15929 TaxID=1121322 RepID=A0A1M7DUU6_9FIRM|nr:ECF transporter S component [Anaerocolumna jejuensis]SHL83281.1 Riboflavin transporter FmnP [Anaerocolumna jejuensis DSM 15929]